MSAPRMTRRGRAVADVTRRGRWPRKATAGLGAIALLGCGTGGATTSTADLLTSVKTTVKDLQSFESVCSPPGAHPSGCDQSQMQVTKDVADLDKSAPNWAPAFAQTPLKDALTAATSSALDPAAKLADARVVRLLLTRVQAGIGTVSPSLSNATASATLPPGYAKQMALLLPAVSIEVSTAASTCAAASVENCELEVLVAIAGESRLASAHGGLTVSPADQGVDAILSPAIDGLGASLAAAGQALIAGQPIDPASTALWETDSQVYNKAALELAG